MKNLTSLLSGLVLLGGSACYGASYGTHALDELRDNVNKPGAQGVSPEEQKEQDLRMEAYAVASCIAYAELDDSCRRTHTNELLRSKLYSADAESKIPFILKSIDSNEDKIIGREELDKAYQRIPLKPDYCETVELKEGKYVGIIASGKEAEYEVLGNSLTCWLWIGTLYPGAKVIDYDCNSTADRVYLTTEINSTQDYSREQLDQIGYAQQFDRLLSEAQKLVCPKNKVPRNEQEQVLDDLLNSYL